MLRHPSRDAARGALSERLWLGVRRASWPSSQACYRLVLEGGGLVVLALAISATLKPFYRPIGSYDEGVLLTGAHLLLRGELPYRDFYTNYPPGIFLLLAGLFKLSGISVAAERGLGVALHVVVAVLAGRLGGRALGQRFSFLIAGIVATWLVTVGAPAYAWFAGLSLALLACVSWPWAHARGRPLGYVLVGAVLGVLSWFRHDLFVYFGLMLGAFAAGWLALEWRRGRRSGFLAAGSPLRGALWVGCGAGVVAAMMWVPVFALAGPSRVSSDLYFDQVRYTMPARVLPLPPLFELGKATWSPVPMPAFLRLVTPAAVLLTLMGPVLALGALLFPRASGSEDRASLTWLAALSVAVLPQMLGRTDTYHAIFAVTPALIACGLWVLGGPARPWRPIRALALAGVSAAVLYLPIRNHAGGGAYSPPVTNRADLARAGRTPVSDARRRVLSFVRKYTQRDDPIYVGLTDHRWTFKSEMDLYFLADRVGATRYMQFDPNLNNREDVQRQTIAELEQSQAKVAILLDFKNPKEPNESRNQGSALLDQYLRSNYQVKGRADRLVMMLRKPAAAPVAARAPGEPPANRPVDAPPGGIPAMPVAPPPMIR